MDVHEAYVFTMMASKGASARRLAQEAEQKASEFFGDLPFTLEMQVSGMGQNWAIECQANAKVAT